MAHCLVLLARCAAAAGQNGSGKSNLFDGMYSFLCAVLEDCTLFLAVCVTACRVCHCLGVLHTPGVSFWVFSTPNRLPVIVRIVHVL